MKATLLLVISLCCATTMGATRVDSAPESPGDSTDFTQGVSLDNVVVYGNRNNFGVTSSQMSAVTLSGRQILSVPVFLGEPDVLKSIQKLPGVQQGSEGTAGIFVRGGDYDQNHITLDGSAIYNAEHMRGYVSAINADMVQSINFYRGAFPARYGSRLSSVIDVGIKEGDYDKYHGLLSLGMLSGRVQAEGPILKGRTSFNVAGRMSYFSLIAKPLLKHYYDAPEALQPYSSMKYYDITAKVVHKFNNRNRLSAVFYYGKDIDDEAPTKSSTETNTIGDATVLASKQFSEETHHSSSTESGWKNMLASMYLTTFLTDIHRLNVNLSYSSYLYEMSINNAISNEINDLYRLYYTYNEVSRLTTRSDVKDLALTADASLKVGGKHLVRYGAKVSRQWLAPANIVFKDAAGIRFRGGLNYPYDEDLIVPKYNETREHIDYRSGEDLSVGNVALYAEDDFSFLNRLKLNCGVRLSSYFVTGKTFFAVEPRASLRVLVTEDFSVKASYSNMSQGLHRLVSNNLVMPSDIWVPVMKDLPLMRSNLFALGINYDMKGFNLSAEAYYKTLDNVLEYRNGATYFIADQSWREIVALGMGRSYGAELMVEKKVGNTTGWLSYTWSKALRTFDRPGNEINGGKEFYSSADHRHNLSINLSQHLSLSQKLGLDLSASWTYQSGRRGTVPYSITYGQSIQENALDMPAAAFGKVFYYFDGMFISSRLDPYANGLDYFGIVAQPFHTFRNINDFKLPDSHHLDFTASFSIRHRLGESIIGLSVYNLYNHYNVSNVYVGYENNKAVLKGICPFPIMPSLIFTQKF